MEKGLGCDEAGWASACKRMVSFVSLSLNKGGGFARIRKRVFEEEAECSVGERRPLTDNANRLGHGTAPASAPAKAHVNDERKTAGFDK